MTRIALAALVATGLALAGGAAAALVDDGSTPQANDPRASAAAKRWVARSDGLLERTEVATARLGRHVYVAGGFESSTREATAAVERYDLRTDRWRRVADMPLALHHSAAATHDGRLYVVGGYAGAGDLSGEVAALLRYDPRRDRWRRLADAPVARAAHGAAVIDGRLYVVGGVSRAFGTLRRLDVYDIARRRWRRAPSMRVAREHLAVTASGGQLYALAGRAAGEGNFAVAERYDPERRRWSRLPPMTKPRGGNAAAAVGRLVVVFGGEEAAGTIGETEAFDTRRRRWTRLAPMRTPRHGLGAVAYEGRVYAIEGGPQPGLFFSAALEALRVG